MFPKSMGTKKKQKKPKHESIIYTNKNVCWKCGKHGPTSEHHLLDGADRGAADRHGLFVYLCFSCHRSAHDDPEVQREMQEYGQRVFEEKIGTREDFLKDFLKSYIKEQT